MAKRLMQYFTGPVQARHRRPSPNSPSASTRHSTLIAQHQTNPEIAKRLQLNPKTIHKHVSNIFTKLQVADRTQAIIRAREAGLGQGKKAKASYFRSDSVCRDDQVV